MKIMAVCGSGLGSSFMMEMNIKKVLNKLGISAEVEHTDLASVNVNDADLFVMAKDIAASSGISQDKLIVMTNIIALNEYEEKLRAYFSQHH